jgi:hypothetical protein
MYCLTDSEADVGWPALVPSSLHAVTGLRLHLDLQEIQQLKLEFVTQHGHGHCRLLSGPAVLADGCLSGRTTTDSDYLRTRCSHESIRAKHTVRCTMYAMCTLMTVGHLALEKYWVVTVQDWRVAKLDGFM